MYFFFFSRNGFDIKKQRKNRWGKEGSKRAKAKRKTKSSGDKSIAR